MKRKIIRARGQRRKVDVSSTPYSAGYEPIPQIWFQQQADLPPFTFATIRGMLLDPEIRLNFATRAAPIFSAEFGWEQQGQWIEGVKCKHPEVAEFIYKQLQHIWKNFLPAILRAQVWGWSGGEVVLKLGEHGLLEVDKLEPRHAMDVTLLKDGWDRWGIMVDRVREKGSVMLPFPYAWFHAYNNEDGEDYGISAAHGAYSPWADKWFNGGARDVRRLFMHKDAYGGVDLGFPDGETWIDGVEQPVPNRDIARQIVEQLRSGGVTTRPSERDENGNEKWPLTRATVPSNPSHILEYPKDLDVEMRHGMEIPDDIVSAETGAWAGKRVTFASFYASLDHWIVQIVCDLKEQIFDHLVRLNFGKDIPYEITAKPLADQAMEQQANAGPGGQPGADGMGMPPDMQGPMGALPDPNAMQPPGLPAPDQPPIAMSLAAGEITAKDVLNEAFRVARLSLAQINEDDAGDADGGDGYEMTAERIEALAELLAAIYGDNAESILDQVLPEDKPVKLAVWNPDDHPRGPDGRLIKKGTDEAYGIAREKVDAAHRSRTSESMSDLLTHLNTLTVKQLHQLKRDYGTKAAAKTKAALIAKLSERLISGRHRTERKDEPTTPPPPGKAKLVNVEEAGEDGVAKTARVGVGGREVPPPPKISRLPNLTKQERAVEDAFIAEFERDPDGMANRYRQYVYNSDKPNVFETDAVKLLSSAWNDETLEKQQQKRALYNNALHQVANAACKRAFLSHLDTLQPGDNVLVTVGGCGAGKGYTLKNTEKGKGLAAEAKAVWDSAGDQNATENPWIQEEAEKRGLKVTYAYIAGDPKVAWAHPDRGIVQRAHNPADGRMVDAAVFADSYVLGAKNHHAFHQKHKDNPNANFLFFSAVDQSELPGVPEDSLKLDRKSLYHWAMGSIQSRSDVAPHVMRGGTNGARIWGEEFFGGSNERQAE